MNDKLDDDELRWQIEQMSKEGLGGYFMHARSGLRTSYMSEEWMRAIKASVETGKKLGIDSWIYDENGWPSGSADGKVPAMGENYQQKYLKCCQVEPEKVLWTDRTLGIYVLGDGYRTLRYASGHEAYLRADSKEVMIQIEWINNPYYIDVLSKDAVKAFLDATHEKYYTELKEYFGNAVQGVFTDEPQYAAGRIPWSFELAEIFENEYGYSIISVLPALFFPIEGYRNIRFDFWKTVSNMFSTAFSDQIGKWCRRHNIKFTGHVMGEESLDSQMRHTAGVIPFYAYMDMPGVDWLFRRIGSPIVPKQVSSVAHQLGQKRIISEMFGCSGWNVSFEELKWIAEWQYVLGINTICQHIELYSMRGSRKRDYPPSLFYQQPWWANYKIFNDYFARLSLMLSEGRHLCDVLIIHPLHSAWLEYDTSDNPALRKLDESLDCLSRWLLEMHVDYDYGDEDILCKHAQVDGPYFMVGKARYKVIVLPPSLTLDRSTVRLIDRFIQAGGKVISVGDFPMLVNARYSDESAMFKRKIKCIDLNKDAIKKELEEFSIKIVSENNEDTNNILIQQRDMGKGQRLIFAVNISRDKRTDAKLELTGLWMPKLYKLENADIVSLPAFYDNGKTILKLDFMPMQSYAVLLDKATNENEMKLESHMDEQILCAISDKWHIEPEDLNAWTLDYANISIDGGIWSDSMPIADIQDKLLRLGRDADIALKFNFNLDYISLSDERFYLGIEDAQEFDIYLNGNRINYVDIGWWRDKSIKKVDITNHVVCGINEVIIKRRFYCPEGIYKLVTATDVHESQLNKITYPVELESIYLLGSFGIYSLSEWSYGERRAAYTNGPFVCRPMETLLEASDLTTQGLAFYAGGIKLSQQFDIPYLSSNNKVYIDFSAKPDAVLVKVWLNGIMAGVMPWAPYKLDITETIKQGENSLVIELIGSCRNLLGPHHHIAGELYAVGPSSFTRHKGWTDIETLQEDIWTDRYCFVRFGLNKSPVIKIV